MKTDERNHIETTPLYWDCDCDHFYCHKKDEDNNCCDTCGAHMDDCPDSRVDEVEAQFYAEMKPLLGKTYLVYLSGNRNLQITPNRLDFTGEETDDVVLWDDSLSTWITLTEADIYLHPEKNAL